MRHYSGYKSGKPKFKYHRQDPSYVHSLGEQGREIDQFDQIEQSGVDQNIKAKCFFYEKTGGAGSLVRIGRRPPKPSKYRFSPV